MLAFKKALGNFYSVASVLGSCFQKQPERFYCVANVFAKRTLLNYFSKGQFPDLEIFKFSEMCSRENPIPESSLSILPEYYKLEESKANEIIEPYLLAIDQSICKMVSFT